MCNESRFLGKFLAYRWRPNTFVLWAEKATIFDLKLKNTA